MHRIAIIGGDGTGPEVIREALKVLEAAKTRFGFSCETVPYDLGGERYLRTKETCPDSVVDELRSMSAILLGAIGHPDVAPGILEKGILLKLRFALDQYVNLRPVKLYREKDCPIKGKTPKDIDFVVVRENTQDLYCGMGGVAQEGTQDEAATQVALYTRAGVDRCLRYAFELARKRGKAKKLTLCGKTNVLTYIYGLWERAFHEMGKAEFPDVTRDYAHVDATCMWMVKNPEWFDVIVTGNLFGDIITDLGAMLQGGMGIAAGGNINPEGVSMFEPIGGSAPKYTGRNVINPLAAIGAMGMMLETLGEDDAAKAVDDAIQGALGRLDSLAAGKMGFSTTQVGDMVAEAVAKG